MKLRNLLIFHFHYNMNAKYENESFLSTGSNAYGEREEESSLLQHEEEYPGSSCSKIKEYGVREHGKRCDNCVEKYNIKKRNKKWNYFIIFFLGICFGFAIWPFFMTLITYKLFSESMDSPNFKTKPGSPTHPSHRRDPHSSNSSDSSDGPRSTSSPSPTIKPSNTYVNDSKDQKNGEDLLKQEQQKKQGSSHFKPIRFDEIAGIDESKVELLEVVDFIKNREKYYQMGARMPKGVLLVGPPGSGKTMLARAVATEANVPYIYTSGPEFIEIYVGQGAKRIRQLFAHARSVAPSIVFIDEIDAVGGKRSSGGASGGTGQREHDQTLNQLLVEMDGFSNTTNIMVIGATNRIDTLDSALLRPGRFDRIVYVPLPDVNGRKKILQIYVKKIKSSLKEEDILRIARLTPGFSGADLENIVNEATILATRNGKEFVTLAEMAEARDKVSMGPERKSLRQSEFQRRMTAYHEAGHAIVAYFLHPKTDPIHKATIISRGNALGYVEQIPTDDRHNYFRSQMEAKLAVCMGGRTAEEIVFGKTETSSGAASDISSATEIAYKMVTEWGMSDKLGPLNYKKRLGDGFSVNRLSAKTIATIENEVKSLVERGKMLSEEILRKHRKELDNLALALLDKETLSGEEIKMIIDPNNTKNYTTSCDSSSDKTSEPNIDNLEKEKNNSSGKENDIKNMSTSGLNDSTNVEKVDNVSSDESRNITNKIDESGKKEESERRFSQKDIATIKKIAKHDLHKITMKNAKRTNETMQKLQMLNFDKKENRNINDNEITDQKNREKINEVDVKKMNNLYDHLFSKKHGNIMKNINKLYESKMKNKDNLQNNTNDNSSTIDDFVKAKVKEMNNATFSDPYRIDNVEEMKKLNLFEHNLSKIFFFDMFNNFH